MNFQYFFIAISISLILFLIALGLSRIIKIFIGNYFAGFTGLISYLFIDILINLIDQGKIYSNNPDFLSGFLMNNKVTLIILIYFIALILFYKSSLFTIEINGLIKKIIGYLFLPILTVLNLIFTMLLIINGPSILHYQNYQNLINSFNLNNQFLITVFNILPGVVIVFPILILILFVNISLKISFPSIRKKEKKDDSEKTSEN